MSFTMLAGIVLLVLSILTLLKIGTSKDFNLDADNLPEVIKNSRIWKKEFEFISWKLKLVSKPDVVFEHGKEKIIGEVKSRKVFKIYNSDVIQMSVAKAILEESGSAVSDVGFVKIVTTDGSRWFDKKLLGHQEVLELQHRYEQIKGGFIEPAKCNNRGVCKNCEFYTVC